MTVEPKLTIAGNSDLAVEVSRHALSAGMADPVYLWRDPADPVVGRSPVVIVADPDERAGFARLCLEADVRAVTLPIPSPDDDLRTAIETGHLKQVSRLLGVPVMARLYEDCLAGVAGRRYGVFAAHRLPRNHAALVEESLADLVCYATLLIDSPFVSLREIDATPPENGFAGRFVIARFADDTIATLEVSVVLPDAPEPHGEVLFELTGAEGVLRAEPERQSVRVHSSGRDEVHQWYDGPADGLLRWALRLLQTEDSQRQQSALRMMQSLADATS